MATNFILQLSIIIFILSLLSVTYAAPSAPAPAADCSNLVLNMVDCLSFVTAGSTTKNPEGTCCSGLKIVLKTDAECLCETFRNSAQLGVTLNLTKAMTLPAACHVSAPSVSNCGLVATGGAPALSPVPSVSSPAPTSTVAGTPIASIGINDVAPVPSLGSSDSSALAISMKLLVLTAVASVSFALF